ncbi:thiamine-phosphate synthase [Anaplasma platys]|uniref:Thiamine-phosphate synthase n=1 Tax=Anaplasma platys TaxID=949 RepID=A0A858PYV9_9RICK|nr:thiamine phosphate synthase [Anaplasma platys]QJC27752.1 thiamine-phosphate synthase [Anaplasma platys]
MYFVGNPGCGVVDVAEFARDYYARKKLNIYVANVCSGADSLCFDYYYDGTEELWFQYRLGFETDVEILTNEFCDASGSMSSVSRCENSRDVDLDCVVLARAKTSKVMEDAAGAVAAVSMARYIPSISSSAPDQQLVLPSYCVVDRIGFYPIVPDERWFELVASCGVKVIQLRVKDKTLHEVDAVVQRCAEISRRSNVALVVNDYWEIAKKHGAYGVHLGQDDIKTVDMDRIAGMCLGISTHCYHELARARFYQPSYIALGPIYGTTSKKMPYRAQGIDLLREWVEYNSCGVVAIGGITLSNVSDVLECNVGGVAVISAVTTADNPKAVIEEFLSACDIGGRI